jgi:hypothetical protein
MRKRQNGMGWLGVLIVLGIVAGGGYYAYQAFTQGDEAADCASAQNACMRNCRRASTEAAAAEACQADCQREAASCANRGR